MSNARTGIFGGTFDPVHNAHLDIARAALEFASLDEVHFVVAARPPHKPTVTHASPEDRLEMVRAAVKNEPRFVASDIELNRQGYSYTVDTLREFEQRLPGAKLFLIIGYDSLLDLPHWRLPGEIVKRAELLVVPRPRMQLAPTENLKGLYKMLPFEETDLSSTKIRDRVAAGESITGLVPPEVERIIYNKGIYQHADHRQPAR